ncbi:FtsB family cell division protein [Limosilactobacillus fastidiosus]|uniref:Septum formation initiator family protein n=1 Tax=Limosilactobacillus fastidiosus TaxID=2759855 RepID=A0A7W3YD10_9LACO|nr:septum formation initiator family protein [Limosilactobacillus fastidiosus]MBB1062232.1 septum formation initiator family protein [Limosilactobacillus fastidiosus]MBB1086567.1 septum formation initiator family protein [Limosilactobacillus fastidiosus]MCD7084396.1 septum formation initiator family protein [Limosilactobacillus fastidiosus]MCD7086543.1 septum formation initiator family protein [Limosilactobacillus fastidiosus]MCD7115251.1 septum formation initiator family protein [Limosilactob
MKSRSGKVSQINTPYARQITVNQQVVRRTRIKRCKLILLFFTIVFLILGLQIIQNKRSLTKINASIRTSKTQLVRQKEIGKDLKQEKKQLHNPDYLQQIIRSKYNYTKKGETVYNLDN